MKSANRLQLFLFAGLLTTSIPSFADLPGIYQARNQVCTGSRVITEYGNAGVIEGLFLDQRRASVKLDGFRGVETIQLDELAFTQTCERRTNICTGDRFVTEDGASGTIVAIFLNRYAAMVSLDGFLGYERENFVNLAMTNVCENIGGGCKYKTHRFLRMEKP